MSRTSCIVLAVAFGLFPLAGECRAQVGFGAQQGLVNSGGRFGVSPVVTNNRRYARLGLSVGFSQLVDVQTFSPVRGFPGLLPTNTIGPGGVSGIGFTPGLNPGAYRLPARYNSYNPPPIRKPTSSRFVAAAWQLDKDKDAKLNRDELANLAASVVAELKRNPVAYAKLKRGASSPNKPAKSVTEKQVTEAFLKQCLTFDRDKDNALNPHETDVLASALIRFLK
jgi:hypothetical protein